MVRPWVAVGRGSIAGPYNIEIEIYNIWKVFLKISKNVKERLMVEPVS